MPPGVLAQSTPDGSSPLHHILPTPPPLWVPLGAPCYRPHFELHVVPRMIEMDVAEAKLANVLVVMVDGMRLTAHPDQVLLYLPCHFLVEPHEVQVHRLHPDDFILIFNSAELVARVLLAPLPQDVELVLRFRCWHHQSRALFSPLWFKVPLAIDNIPAHAWLPETVHTIIGSSCLSFDLTPTSINRADLSRFFIIASAIHPDLIPNEVKMVVPEPEEPF
jgi:hypothetical protein